MKAKNEVAMITVRTAQRIATTMDTVEALGAADIFDLIDMLRGDVPGMSDLTIWQALGYGVTHRMFSIISHNDNTDEVMLTCIDRTVEVVVVEERMLRDSDDMFRHLMRGSNHVRDYIAAL